MNTTTKCLDHGYVRLVASLGDDSSIVRSARVSHDGDSRTGTDLEGDLRLIRYLYSHGHNTPFESVVLTFEVKAPIFVARQWMRHRTWSYNEISARYSPLPDDFYVPSVGGIGISCSRNKQSSNRSGSYPDRDASVRKRMQLHNREAYKLYERLINDEQVPRELARMVLPSSIYTRFYGTVNLHNLFCFLRERLDEHAQYEIRVYAEAILNLIARVVPVATKEFYDDVKGNK